MRRIGLLAVLLIAVRLHAVCPAKWGYEPGNGPNRWGQMEDAWAACDAGKAQSPINIDSSMRAALPPLRLVYRKAPLVVQNTGHELKVPTTTGTLTFDGETAQLIQFHFHTPSEHTMSNQEARAELHLVHKTASGKLFVVGVLIDKGDLNVPLQTILDFAPHDACTSKKAVEGFNPQTLVPRETKDFFTYAGSLTTPACSEGVTWFVLFEHITASGEQLEALEVGHGNARPVQPIGDRIVRRSF
jgi:carbonic anhydrase